MKIFMFSMVRRFAFVLATTAVLNACAVTSPFNQAAYERATSLKVDVLESMENAVEPFETHKTEVAQLKTDLAKAYEYAKGRPHNEESTEQWRIMQDPTRNLLGGFLKRWEEKSTLSAAFIDAAQTNVADGFDQIIGLESGKIRSAHARDR